MKSDDPYPISKSESYEWTLLKVTGFVALGAFVTGIGLRRCFMDYTNRVYIILAGILAYWIFGIWLLLRKKKSKK
jgi:hypothetical protein